MQGAGWEEGAAGSLGLETLPSLLKLRGARTVVPAALDAVTPTSALQTW